MESFEIRLNNLITLIDSTNLYEWVEIKTICFDENSFIQAVKHLIDVEKKPYEFNGNYTKVRRIENVAD